MVIDTDHLIDLFIQYLYGRTIKGGTRMRQEKAFLPGDYVFFGTETRMGEPREWVVLMTNTEERTALIATTKSVAEIPYHNRHNEYAGRDPRIPLR